MAMVLILLLASVFTENRHLTWAAILCLVIDMTWPDFFIPVARVWTGLSRMLGACTSRVILGLVYLGLVVPVGVARRFLGFDSLQLTKWKRGRESVFRVRSARFRAEDIQRPY